MTSRVATLGEAMLRMSPADGRRLQDSRQLDSHVAGAEANVAVALASLGVDTRFISAVPDNPMGGRVTRSLAAAGVDLSFVSIVPDARLGLFFVEFGAAPRSTTVWYDREGSAFSRMDSFDPQALEGVELVVTSGITLAISDQARDLAYELLSRARDTGVSICVDVNYRERLCSPQTARELLEPALAQAEIVVCSRRDAARVFEIETGDTRQVAIELRDLACPSASHVVITEGDRGCAAVVDGEVLAQEAFPAQVVDRIGAGDAFLAGLIWGLLSGAEAARSLEYACALGALALTVPGDQAPFNPRDVEATLSRKGDLIR